jgi:hypothetical protein
MGAGDAHRGEFAAPLNKKRSGVAAGRLSTPDVSHTFLAAQNCTLVSPVFLWRPDKPERHRKYPIKQDKNLAPPLRHLIAVMQR